MSIPQHLQYRYENGRALPANDAISSKIRPLIAEHVPVGSRILDLGCGNGSGSGYLLKEGYRVTGVDPSERGVALAKVWHPAGSWHLGMAEPGLLETLGEEPFDAVMSVEVVEHVYAPREWAACCYECLKPGGLLICTTPYHGYLKNLVLSLTNRWDKHMSPMWDGGHIKLWSRKTLQRLLLEVGFTDLRFSGAGRWPGLWMSMIFIAQKPGPSGDR